MEDVYDEEEVVLRGLLLAPQVRLLLLSQLSLHVFCASPTAHANPFFTSLLCCVLLFWCGGYRSVLMRPWRASGSGYKR